MFYNETEDNPGMMMWRYPEPRILTFVRITPVPFNTTEDPEISTADLGDVLQVSTIVPASNALGAVSTFILLLTQMVSFLIDIPDWFWRQRRLNGKCFMLKG